MLQAEGKLSFPRTLPRNNKHMMPLESGFSLLPFWVFRISHLQTHEGICLCGKYVLHVDFSRRLSADVHMWARFLPSKIIIFSFGCGHMVSNSWNSYSGRTLLWDPRDKACSFCQVRITRNALSIATGEGVISHVHTDCHS